MTRNKKLIITDLDGTLLNNKSELTPETILVVRKIIAEGHKVCISTGRPYRSAIKFYKELGLNTIMSTINGGYIVNPNDPNFIPINNVFSKEILFNLLENKIIRDKMVHLYIENQEGGFLFSKEEHKEVENELIELFHINKDDINRININDKSQWKNIKYDLYSILINVDEKYLDEISFEVKSYATTLFVDYWKNPGSKNIITLEIRTVFQNKGSSMEFISCYYGIPLRNTYAFGDGKNDIDMMKLTTRSFAMKNAHYSVKVSSYRITTFDNDNDGVVRELENALLRNR